MILFLSIVANQEKTLEWNQNAEWFYLFVLWIKVKLHQYKLVSCCSLSQFVKKLAIYPNVPHNGWRNQVCVTHSTIKSGIFEEHKVAKCLSLFPMVPKPNRGSSSCAKREASEHNLLTDLSAKVGFFPWRNYRNRIVLIYSSCKAKFVSNYRNSTSIVAILNKSDNPSLENNFNSSIPNLPEQNNLGGIQKSFMYAVAG
jgi:hypothetical protein